MRLRVLLVAEVAQQRQAPTLCASGERLGGIETIPTTTGDAPSALAHLIGAIRTESTKAHPATPQLAGARVELDGTDRLSRGEPGAYVVVLATERAGQLVGVDGKGTRVGIGEGGECSEHAIDVVWPKFCAANQCTQDAAVAAGVQQHAARLQAITTGTTRLLRIRLDRLGEAPVPDLPNVGFVDAHSEGSGGDDDRVVRAHKSILALLAHVAAETRVIRLGGQSGSHEGLCDHLAVFAGSNVDNRRAGRFDLEAVLEQLQTSCFATRLDCVKREVRAIKAGVDLDWILQSEAANDVDAGGRGSGCRQGHHRAGLEGLAHLSEAAIVGSEVVAPFAQTVRLVDDQQVDVCLGQRLGKACVRKAFGCHVEQANRRLLEQRALVTTKRREDCVDVVAARIARQGSHVRAAEPSQGLDLVAHQCEQGRHHDRQAQRAKCWQLVAERFARPRWHDDQGVATIDGGLHRGLLSRPEGVVPEDVFEQAVGIGRHGGSLRSVSPYRCAGLAPNRHAQISRQAACWPSLPTGRSCGSSF